MLFFKSTELEWKSKDDKFDSGLFPKRFPPGFQLVIKFPVMLLFESPVKVSVHLSPKVLIFISFSFLSSLFLSPNIFLFMSIIEFAGV